MPDTKRFEVQTNGFLLSRKRRSNRRQEPAWKTKFRIYSPADYIGCPTIWFALPSVVFALIALFRACFLKKFHHVLVTVLRCQHQRCSTIPGFRIHIGLAGE